MERGIFANISIRYHMVRQICVMDWCFGLIDQHKRVILSLDAIMILYLWLIS